ncbi:Multidrug resistance protein B [Pseudomonas orientalis]|uniref:MFS transporter n=1 Tax=Pseudomonas orientalis TaxID=76758 RepID=UPI000F55D36B|nr:MFS transporter [Pseudomonas orientalis]AZE92913.1 Multidrug resistance protein B [Pseudomonas orientalis]AZE98267.1 Multidrug resistance protein B [Pseudomonas orientalis]
MTNTLRICIVKLLFTASNFIIPFSALFVSKRYDFDASALATMVTVLSVSYLIGNLAGGYLGDKFQSRSLLLLFSFCSLLTMIIGSMEFPAAVTFAAISIFAVMAGAANPVLSNYLSNSVDESNRESSFGNLYLANNIGIAIVFIVGGFLLARGAQYPLYFFTALSALSFLCTALLLKPVAGSSTPDSSIAKSAEIGTLSAIIACSFVLFFGLAFLDAQREYQLPVWLDSLNKDSSSVLFGTIGIVNAAIVLLLTKYVVKITAAIDPIMNMGIAALFYGFGFGIHYFFGSLYPVLALVVLWSIGEILGATYMSVFISKNAPGRYRAKLFSLIPVVLTLGKILSISTTTGLASVYGINSGWVLAFGVGVLAFLFSVSLLAFTKKAGADDTARYPSATL